MVDWSIFWNNIFPGLIILVTGWGLAFWLVHRYQRKYNQKQIISVLVDNIGKILTLLGQILNLYYEWCQEPKDKNKWYLIKNKIIELDTSTRILAIGVLNQLEVNASFHMNTIDKLDEVGILFAKSLNQMDTKEETINEIYETTIEARELLKNLLLKILVWQRK